MARMAVMYPKQYPGEIWAEAQVFEALAKLPDDWHVISDVFFPVQRKNAPTLDGQVDFVLVHRKWGVIVMEVKGGTVAIRGGEWETTNRDGTFDIKDPFKQANDYKWHLKKIVLQRTGHDLFFMHAVALPSTSRPAAHIGAHPTDLVLFKADLDSPTAAIDRVLAYHKPSEHRMSRKQVDDVVDLFAPTISIKPRLVDLAGSAVKKQIELTRQQRIAFEGTRSMSRVWVRGGAGTGKTVLAMERARKLANEGARVLLSCYNKPLGDQLRSQLSDQPLITAGHFHNIATRLGRSRPAGVSDSEWLDSGLADAMFDKCTAEGHTWDAVIIDEAQDFSAYWLEVLEQLLDPKGRGQLIAFSDDNQRLFRDRDRASLPAEPYELTVNCRNTPEINESASRPLGITMECLRESGLNPTVDVVAGDLMPTVRTRLHEIVVDGGIPVDRVAVLSPSRPLIDKLQDTRIGRWDAVEIGCPGLVCETVHRFKGLEADAVVLVLPDDGPFDPKLFYVGASRACAVLSIVAGPRAAANLGLLDQP